MLGYPNINIQDTLTMYGDEELLQQMSNNNRHAFTILYRRYWEDLFITAAKALRSKEEAADVVQEVFLSLWKRRNEINIQSSLGAYLHTSVRYTCIHYIEKNIHRRDYLDLLGDVAINTSSLDPENAFQIKHMEETINKTVSKMPAKMQEVYKLSRQQHMSHKEIADSMSISVETVKKHIQHALNLIRTHLPSDTYILATAIFFYLS
jgi:RNA polymerase sigma-70 factor (ECF subfamily)